MESTQKLPQIPDSFFSVSSKRALFLVVIGILTGIALVFNYHAQTQTAFSSQFSTLLLQCGLSSLGTILFLFILRAVIRFLIYRLSIPEKTKALFYDRDSIGYLIFLAPLLGAFGIQTHHPLIFTGIIVLFLISQLLLFLSTLNSFPELHLLHIRTWLSFLFFISGFAALIYQIVWQRILFTEIGVNSESVTLIVSVFMFGLGIGSLFGGYLSEKFKTQLPLVFLGLELLIGLFGVFSISFIHFIGQLTVHQSYWVLFLGIYAVLFFPTLLMGATLPVLTTYLHQLEKSIGRSVGLLYAINAAGSAIACFLTAELLFAYGGLIHSIGFAVFCNFIVGFLVYRFMTSPSSSSNSTSPK